jgi:hypothetical protein
MGKTTTKTDPHVCRLVGESRALPLFSLSLCPTSSSSSSSSSSLLGKNEGGKTKNLNCFELSISGYNPLAASRKRSHEKKIW